MVFAHHTVLLEETVSMVVANREGIYVDCTLGGAGHSRRVLQLLDPAGRLVAFDQDPQAIEHAKQVLAGDQRVHLVHANFALLEAGLRERKLLPVDGILFDLGVSSPQLDEAERGFSYMQDAPLDMRMNPQNSLTAGNIVNTWSEQDMAKVIRDYGEEKWAARIAQFIAVRRRENRIRTTGELVDIIKSAIPAAARREGPHPAKRTFQALRIAVNNELGVLAEALDQAIRCLAPGGRVAVITFHSLEDRIVKQRMQAWRGNCTCPPGLPFCVCGTKAIAKVITRKPVLPSAQEIEANPRARSAKLRVAEKI